MDKIAMYKEEIMKEASVKKDDAKREKDLETRMWRDRVKPELKRGLKSFPATLGGAMAGGVAGNVLSGGNPKAAQIGGLATASIASYKSRRKQEKQELDRLSNKHFGKDATKEQHDTVKSKRLAATAFNAIPGAGVVGAIVSNTKTPESVIQKARREKSASETLDELVKEAGIVSHASRATNGIKRTGQLLTGSYARGLKKSLKNLNNKPAGSFQDSLKVGEKMMLTQKELGKEVGKVRATRAGVAGAVGVGALNTNKKEEPSI